MKELLILLRTLNLHYHHLHNTAQGPSFAADHDMMAAMYAEADADYDALAERYIGLTGEMSREMLVSVVKESADILANMPLDKSVAEQLKFALNLEQSLCSEIASRAESHTAGTRNLMEGLADKSEVRQYKLQQRWKS